MSINASVINITKLLNIGLIGTGEIGKLYLKAITSNKKIRLIYIVDDDINKAKKLLLEEPGLEYTIAIPFEEASLLFEDESIDGVIVTSTAKSYKSWVVQALKADMTVYCDVPLLLNLEDTLRCCEVSKKTRQMLVCGFNQRFHSHYVAARNEIRTGNLGKITLVKVSAIASKIRMESMLHQVDLICWLLDSYPDSVIGTFNITGEENEAAVLTMKFGGGATIGLIATSRRDMTMQEQILEVCGTSSSISVSNGKSSELAYHRNNGSTFHPIKSETAQSPFQHSYAEIINHFADVSSGTANLMVPLGSVISAAKIMEAIKTSVDEEKYITVDKH